MLRVVDHVAAHADRTPDAVAITCRGEATTYGLLMKRVNAIAHVLQQQGIRKGDYVGIMLERCAVAGALHVLAASGRHFTMFPVERLARCVVTASARAHRTRPTYCIVLWGVRCACAQLGHVRSQILPLRP
jgi:acyl-CoA synthetase (AMP-forming)/AMP-acid ligase II